MPGRTTFGGTVDELNCQIWVRSLDLQRAIATMPNVGAQQAMPKPEHEHLFSPANPLPWVPDLVGKRFMNGGGTLVVGSSYNGFLEGYSSRSFPVAEYVAARDMADPTAGVWRFQTAFLRHAVKDDPAYYGPIKRLLGEAGLDTDACALTDICKASFIERTPKADKGSDTLIHAHWEHWIRYVRCGSEDGEPPLPVQWIWERIQQANTIVALGAIAEYALSRILHECGVSITAVTKGGTKLRQFCTAHRGGWEFCKNCLTRRIGERLRAGEWLRVSTKQGGAREWRLVTVFHPSAVQYGHDPGYALSSRLLREAVGT